MPRFIPCMLHKCFRDIATLLVTHAYQHLSAAAMATSQARKCVHYMVDMHFGSLEENEAFCVD